jgi:hypothetical protein
MTRCLRCNRPLKNAPGPHGMGPSCERAMFGTKPAQIHVERRITPDPAQVDLFPGWWASVRGALGRIGRWLGGEDHE